MDTVQVRDKHVSRVTVGGNPFSGFSHQGPDRDKEMTDYFTNKRIKEFLRSAETLGVNTLFARTDYHIMGVLREYWEEGGTIQWFAQVCPDVREDCPPSETWMKWMAEAAELDPAALYIHGGIVDNWFANEQFDVLAGALERIRGYGTVAVTGS